MTEPPLEPPAPAPPPPYGDPTQHALTALLAEHASLRQESVQAIANRIAVMNFTFGALAVVIAGLLAGEVDRTVAGLIALFFVPQMAKAGLLIWLGEYHRSMRAGAWLARVETQVNRLVAEPNTLTWESSLIARSSHMDFPYVATAAFILGAGYLGSLLGVFDLVMGLPPGAVRIAGAGVLLLYAIGVEAVFARFFWRRWRDTRLDPLAAHILPEPPRGGRKVEP